MAPTEDLLRQLRSLPPEDLKQVQLKMSAWGTLQGKGDTTTAVRGSPRVEEDYLLEGVHYELRRRGLLGTEARLYSRVWPPNYVNSSIGVRNHIAANLRLKPVERVLFGRLAIRALAEYLENGRVPISGRTLMLNIDKTITALDAAYPGYLAAGLLRFCLHN